MRLAVRYKQAEGNMAWDAAAKMEAACGGSAAAKSVCLICLPGLKFCAHFRHGLARQAPNVADRQRSDAQGEPHLQAQKGGIDWWRGGTGMAHVVRSPVLAVVEAAIRGSTLTSGHQEAASRRPEQRARACLPPVRPLQGSPALQQLLAVLASRHVRCRACMGAEQHKAGWGGVGGGAWPGRACGLDD